MKQVWKGGKESFWNQFFLLYTAVNRRENCQFWQNGGLEKLPINKDVIANLVLFAVAVLLQQMKTEND